MNVYSFMKKKTFVDLLLKWTKLIIQSEQKKFNAKYTFFNATSYIFILFLDIGGEDNDSSHTLSVAQSLTEFKTKVQSFI